jgi:hypothetical protein
MTQTTVSPDLIRDLALVLPRVLPGAPVGDTTVTARAAGQPIDLPSAIARAVEWIDASPAVALVGLNNLSIEALREAVALAEKTRGRLLPRHTRPDTDSQTITQTATLGHAAHSNLLVWVGLQPDDWPAVADLFNRIKPFVYKVKVKQGLLNPFFKQ